jgi:two-component system, OmpR family, response regulator
MNLAVSPPVNDSTLKVLLVEDSRVLADRLMELIDQTATVDLVAHVDNERDAVALLRGRHVDVVILDLQLRHGTGFGVLKSLPKSDHRPRVIVLTNYDLPVYRREATHLGADYFLDKSREYHRVPEILEALSAADAG